jgi:hypothetical protein
MPPVPKLSTIALPLAVSVVTSVAPAERVPVVVRAFVPKSHAVTLSNQITSAELPLLTNQTISEAGSGSVAWDNTGSVSELLPSKPR